MKLVKLLSVAFILLVSCSKSDENTSDDRLKSNNITANVNGAVFSSTGYGHNLAKFRVALVNKDFFELIILGSATTNDNIVKRITISAFVSEKSHLGIGLEIKTVPGEYVNNPYCKFTEHISEIGKEEIEQVSANSYVTGIAHFKLTAVDKTNKTVSGEFSFTAYDADLDKQYDISDGTFNEVIYEDEVE